MKKISRQNVSTSMFIMLTALFAIGLSFSACNQQGKKKEAKQEASQVKEEEEPDDVFIAVEEYEILESPIIVTAKAEPKKEVAAKPEKKEKAEKTEPQEGEDYAIISFDDLNSSLVEQGYEPKVIKVTKAAVPLDETKTVTSYSKKGKEKDALQVVTSSDGSVEQVVFTDKRHKDVYNVQIGMTGKEVKKLRKDMKHVVKKGKVYLYDDKSNIMYLMKAEDQMGNEIGTAKVDSMEVQAIVWKDKRHRKEKE